jgi:hypothetical protein
MTTPARLAACALLAAFAVAACSPTVKLEAPDKPIVINLNVKIEQEVKVRLEKDVDEVAKKKPGIF